MSAASFSLVDSNALQIDNMEPPEALLNEENKVRSPIVLRFCRSRRAGVMPLSAPIYL